MKNQVYKAFGKFVFRTPLFPFNRNFAEFFDTSVFKEALYLASSEFYESVEDKKDIKELSENVKISLYKYLSRASTRCTPFGLFASCSIGEVGDRDEFKAEEREDWRSFTKLDMQYICLLIHNLEKKPEIRKQLKYFPNDTIYEVNGKYRYIEYQYVEYNKLHKTVSIEKNIVIKKVLKCALKGATYQVLLDLINEYVEYEEAESFLEELINSQVIKSELEIQITGEDQLTTLIEKLSKLQNTEEVLIPLLSIKSILEEINNSKIGEGISLYKKVFPIVEHIGTKCDPKYLFQTDLYRPFIKASLSEETIEKIFEAAAFLSRINPPFKNTLFDNFKNEFQNRYGESEVPLSHVLDDDIGIGFPPKRNSDINSLIDDLTFPVYSSGQVSNVMTNQFHNIIFDKYIEALISQKRVINLKDEDFESFKENWEGCPTAMNIMGKVINSTENDKVFFYLHLVGNSTPNNVIGRFCYMNEEILSLAKAIANKEAESESDAILAEIVHLPKARLGNILVRPVIRPYEIHYLANSGTKIENQIDVDDLMLSVRRGYLFLRSKKYNKEVIPKLSSAHSFNNNSSSSIYRFLGNMQFQKQNRYLAFSWGKLENRDYYPRVVYKECILSREKWLIKKEEIKDADKLSDEELLQFFGKLIEKRALNKCVIHAEGDNEIFIDFTDSLSIRVFLSLVKKKEKFYVEEFLFDKNDALIGENGACYTNEFIIPFYKQNN